MRAVGRQSSKHSLALLCTASRKHRGADMGHAGRHEVSAVCISAGQGNHENMSSHSGRAGLLRAQAPGVAADQAASTVRRRQRSCQPSARSRAAVHAARSRRFTTAGCGVAASRGWGQHRRVSPTVQLGGRRCRRTHCCHTVAPATRRFTSRSPPRPTPPEPTGTSSYCSWPAGATATRGTNRSRWLPSGPSAGPLQPLAVHL